MASITASFTAVGQAGSPIYVNAGESLRFDVSGTFVATVALQKKVGSGAWQDITSVTTATSTRNDRLDVKESGQYRLACTAFTSGTAVALIFNIGDTAAYNLMAAQLGEPAAVQGMSLAVLPSGAGLYRMDFTFLQAVLTVTDAAGSGSSASAKVFDFVQGAVQALASRQDYTAFAEGAALTTAAGDAAFVMGFGSVAANAGDGALTATEVDFAPVTGTITLAGGTGTGTKMGGVLGLSSAPIDGTGTAVDLFINWSGTAATIDANSTISVTGTTSILVAMLGDD